ncbi:MAG TPA: Lrp/AsnC ligand binding domain-containing protein [candidate division Zixibacteria bacterium]|nr:Lrp/AsnC ligand binding domain-containing protein [candidate division Zixibacteria bacterium]
MNVHEIKDIHSIFVFVDTEPTEDVETMNRILAIDEVKDVYVVSGQYDLLVVLELSVHGTAIFTSIQELAQKAVQKIRKIEGVRETSTIVPFVSITKRVQ